MFRHFVVSVLVCGLFSSSALAQELPPVPTGEVPPVPTINTPAARAPMLEATRRLNRKIKIANRRAKIFKFGSKILAIGGAIGGLGSILSANVIKDPETQSSVAKLGGFSSAISSSVALFFNLEAKAGKNKDCLAYLQNKTYEFSAKWSSGVLAENAAEFEADKDKIENGHGGKCRRLELY